MNVVMIDGGIRTSHPCLQDIDITQYHNINGSWIPAKEIKEETGHGTAIANILASHMDGKIRLINFCVFNKELKASVELLVSALEYIYYNIDTDIINLSLGSLFDNERLYHICKKLSEKNVILVAGFDNNGAVSFPAAYDCVLSVDTSFKCLHKNDFVFVENSIVNLRAMGGNQRVAWDYPDYIITSGTSFAAAHATREIISACKGRDLACVSEHFKKHARYIYHNPVDQENKFNKELFDISRAALFPFSKEIQSLLNFSDMLNFNIEGVYDIKYSGHVGLSFVSLDEAKTFIIKNLDSCPWNEIDTFILGHIMDFDSTVRTWMIDKVIPNCIQNKVNLFCLDFQIYMEYKEQFAAESLKIYTPYIDESKQNKFGKLYKIERPVLSVFGTSSEQGKFTLQLQLRKNFFNHHYNLGQLGTEPTSQLFGMDDCFPFGYNSPLRNGNTDNFEYVEIVNSMLHRIDCKEPDIIMTGCQSNITPILYSNLRNITLDQINFLMGVNPDAVVLCVNPYDHFNYIQRSIQTIEGLSYAKVLAIALYPFTFENNWAILKGKKCKLSEEQLLATRKKLENRFGLPVYEIGNSEDIECLFKRCIDYFTKK